MPGHRFLQKRSYPLQSCFSKYSQHHRYNRASHPDRLLPEPQTAILIPEMIPLPERPPMYAQGFRMSHLHPVRHSVFRQNYSVFRHLRSPSTDLTGFP